MFDFIQNIDISIIEKIYRFQHNLNSELFNKVMIFFTILGDNGMIWIAVALILFLNRKYRKIGVFSIVSLIICALAVNVILKPLIHRPRPFSELADITLLIKAPKDYSFPSGHTAASFVMVYIFFRHIFRHIKKYFIPVLITGILIAFSRMYLTVHFPSDILVGLIIGLLSGYAGEKIADGFYRKKID